MRKALFAVLVAVLASSFDTHAAQRGRTARTGTLAIAVTDPAGAAIPNVLVTVDGPATRSVRTEGGRIALESLPVGRYILRFEQEGFITLERDMPVTAGKPVEVNVTLKPLPAAAPSSRADDPPPSAAKPELFDVPAVIEREFVGRAPQKSTSLSCGGSGAATLIQLNEPLADETHSGADEFIYVVAGEGTVTLGQGPRKVSAGVLVFVPAGTRHSLTPSGRNPLIVLATRAGEGCGPAGRDFGMMIP